MQLHIFTDADNTLWDTDAVYAAAQVSLLRNIEKIVNIQGPAGVDDGLAFVRDIDQRIAAHHPDHLRYPPELLAHAVRSALASGDSKRVAAFESKGSGDESLVSVTNLFIDQIRKIPELRQGVIQVFDLVKDTKIPVTVVTEERKDRCLKLLEFHNLIGSVSQVISMRKTNDSFLQLKQSVDGCRVFMVGDQVDKDIRPAHAAGFETFYFPSGFRPFWSVDPNDNEAHVISRYDEILAYI